MKKTQFYKLLLITIMACFKPIVSADMVSENFRIQNSAQSGGGTAISSDIYQMNSTVGQPSPLPTPDDPPFSESYDLYPGFWYTVANAGLTCPGDFNDDKDVDGSDLAEYLFNPDELGLDGFAANFGKENCP